MKKKLFFILGVGTLVSCAAVGFASMSSQGSQIAWTSGPAECEVRIPVGNGVYVQQVCGQAVGGTAPLPYIGTPAKRYP